MLQKFAGLQCCLYLFDQLLWVGMQLGVATAFGLASVQIHTREFDLVLRDEPFVA